MTLSHNAQKTQRIAEPQKIWMSEKALHMLYGALDEFFNRPPEMGVAATFNVNEDYFEGNFAIPMEQGEDYEKPIRNPSRQFLP